MFVHSIECEELQKEWDTKYPHHCKKCNGAGGFVYPGTYWEPPDYDECSECVGQLKCPLCGADIPEDWDFDNKILPCGHKYDNPEAPSCICEGLPVCQECRHLMEWDKTWANGEYELDIFKCPSCGNETSW